MLFTGAGEISGIVGIVAIGGISVCIDSGWPSGVLGGDKPEPRDFQSLAIPAARRARIPLSPFSKRSSPLSRIQAPVTLAGWGVNVCADGLCHHP